MAWKDRLEPLRCLDLDFYPILSSLQIVSVFYIS